MIVYRLKKDSMGGGGCHRVAFTDRTVAEITAADMCEEWIKWKPVESEAEEIPGGRCVVDGAVYELETTTAREKWREKALAKLCREERDALDL